MYAMAQFGASYNITSEEINVFFAILLLSGYHPVTDYDLYWSISEDCENKMVKSAMTRDRFRILKRCIHFGSLEDQEGETPDRFKKVRMLIKHMQKRFAEYEGCKSKCQTYCEKCNRAICLEHFKAYHVGTGY